MAVMRYYTADILTGDVLGELPLYGTYMNRKINTSGQFTGTYKINSGVYNDKFLLQNTIPGKTCLYCERDDELIWGGILWTRTYSGNSDTIQLQAATFESIFDHVVFEEHVIQQGVEQAILFQNMVNQFQLQENADFGLTFDPLPATGINRTVLLPNYEFHFVNDGLTQLVDADNGVEYTIDVRPGATQDHPDKVIRLGYPNLSVPSDNAFDFPGSVKQLWVPESASRGAIKAAVTGAGTGNKVLRSVAIDGDKLAAGWPAWWQTKANPAIGDSALVTAAARQMLIDNGMPVINPTFQVSNVDLFSAWDNLGALFTVDIEGPRYPSGKRFQERLVGWDYTPPSSDSEESLSFSIAGDGDVSV